MGELIKRRLVIRFRAKKGNVDHLISLSDYRTTHIDTDNDNELSGILDGVMYANHAKL